MTTNQPVKGSMPLQVEEIGPGIIAYFDPQILLHDVRIVKPSCPTPRRGEGKALDPFVCFEASEAHSAWSPLTRQPKFVGERQVRLALKPEWFSRLGVGPESYLNDGATTYVGPNEAFVAAACEEEDFGEFGRLCISDIGIRTIIEQIEARHGTRLKK